MNLNPPYGKIEDNKASRELRNNLETKDINGTINQQGDTSSCTTNLLTNTNHMSTNAVSHSIKKEDKPKEGSTLIAKGNHLSLLHMLDTHRVITYPFNWEPSLKKKMTNTELFTNKVDKKTKQFPFKTSVDEMQKETFFPFEYLQWNKLQSEKIKELAKNKNSNNTQNHSSSFSQMVSKQQELAQYGKIGDENGIENDNDMCKENNKGGMNNKFKECYLDLLIESANALINKGLKLNTLKDYNPQEPVVLNEKSINSTDNITRSPKNQKDKKEQNDTSAVPTTASSIQFFQKKCENKICPVTVNKMSNIHQAKIGTSKNKMLHLCSQCYKAWKNGQYCYYCGVIYREYSGTKGFNESKMWVACEFCKNWEHLACEEQKGVYPNLSKLIKDLKFKYDCPLCRKKKKEKEEVLLKKKAHSKGLSSTQSLLHKKTKNYYNEDYNKITNPLKRNCVSSSLYSN